MGIASAFARGATADKSLYPSDAFTSVGDRRSPQIPAAARMLGINPSTCVQVAFVKISRARRGRRAGHRTPTAIGIGGINSSSPVQVAPVIILAARLLSVGRAYVTRDCDHSYRQRGQKPEYPKAHHVSFYPSRLWLPPNHVICRFVPRPVCRYTSAVTSPPATQSRLKTSSEARPQ